ncbi:hypothetical protein H8959_015869 [Pygathrix nigripes]
MKKPSYLPRLQNKIKIKSPYVSELGLRKFSPLSREPFKDLCVTLAAGGRGYWKGAGSAGHAAPNLSLRPGRPLVPRARMGERGTCPRPAGVCKEVQPPRPLPRVCKFQSCSGGGEGEAVRVPINDLKCKTPERLAVLDGLFGAHSLLQPAGCCLDFFSPPAPCIFDSLVV